MSTNNRGIDWDGELQALMESSGIDPTQLARPTRGVRFRRALRRAWVAIVTLIIALVLMWLTAASGAPAAATVPLRIWLAGWIGHGIWISLGRPDWSMTVHGIREFATVAAQSASRWVFAHSRPARVRWRAWRASKNNNDGTVTATA